MAAQLSNSKGHQVLLLLKTAETDIQGLCQQLLDQANGNGILLPSTSAKYIILTFTPEIVGLKLLLINL